MKFSAKLLEWTEEREGVSEEESNDLKALFTFPVGTEGYWEELTTENFWG